MYHKPDSCTHIAGEFVSHKALIINRHNAACQLIHTTIWKLAKRGAALHSSALDLVLLTADTGPQPETSMVSLEALLSATTTKEPGDMGGMNTPMD